MATRIWFGRLVTALDINQATAAAPDVDWDFLTDAVLRPLEMVKSGAAAGNNVRVTGMNPFGLATRFVSPKLGAQTLAGTVKCQFKAREFNLADNTTSAIGIRVLNSDGTTVRGTLLAVGNQSLPGELVETTTHRNKKFAAATALSSVAMLNGDRLEVAIGFTHASGATPEGQVAIGSDSAGDLPEDDTSTSALDPWIEFSQTILPYAAEPGEEGNPRRGVRFMMHPRLARGIQHQRRRPR